MDIVKRLRNAIAPLAQEAAGEIERLRALVPNEQGGDLFGAPMPDQTPASFDEFWDKVPKTGKQNARKAWGKLTPQEQRIATERAPAFYAWFKRTYKDASPMHPATYLNGKRWEDEAIQATKPASKEETLKAVAKRIKTGHDYLCRDIAEATARQCIRLELVTEAECRQAGVL